jgi:magnesium transporter
MIDRQVADTAGGSVGPTPGAAVSRPTGRVMRRHHGPNRERSYMDVYVVSGFGVKQVPVEELGGLLRQPDALVWVDIPRCDGKTAMVLSETFGFHDIAIRDCLERNHISKLHVYDDHVFTVLHAPEIGSHGHVHYVELDQFLGSNYLVTVHGPLNPAVDPAVASLDTEQVRKRIENGRLHPKTPFELSSAIVSALTRREINLIADLAKQSGDLERKLMLGQVGADPEPFLEELFRAWYELLAIRTIAVHSAATYDRMAKLVRSLPPAEQPLVADIADRFHQVASMADGQREFLHGVIEFFQTRTSTHMTIAAEALSGTSVQQNDDMRRITAWVAIVAVPTAVTGFFGQNVPYPGFGENSGFIASIAIMLIIAATLFLVFKRKDWL